MGRKAQGPSQLVDLFLTVAAELGIESDKDVAALAGVSVENVSNWRRGTVQELKPQKLEAVKGGLAARIAALKERAGTVQPDPEKGLVPIEVEDDSSPAELQRQLRERVHYDYLGHRFLYFEPQGALAWESLIGSGYEQEAWLKGVDECLDAWLDASRTARSGMKGPLASALGFDKRSRTRGVDVLSLGPGEGGKEVRVLERLIGLERSADQSLPWITLALADVSIPLLLAAGTGARRKLIALGAEHANVLPFCADFEEGPLTFLHRLPTHQAERDDGMRLVLILGNVFGNLRDEERFVSRRLSQMVRPGDKAWLEVGVRPDRIDQDPLYRLTRTDREETAAEAHRRLLLEGPYRRWETAVGRGPSRIDMRVFVREDDDSSRIPGSINFCHDLILGDERRTITMLYSRRYEIDGLKGWLERQGYRVDRTEIVRDSKKRVRVAHLLLERVA